MKDDPLSDEDNVVRYVGGSKIDDNGVVLPEAFDNPPISVNWLEFHAGSKANQIACVRGVLRLKIGRTAFFAELNVKKIRGLGLDVLKDPLTATPIQPAAPCHAVIVGVAGNDERHKLIFEKLADIVVAKHPAYAGSSPIS